VTEKYDDGDPQTGSRHLHKAANLANFAIDTVCVVDCGVGPILKIQLAGAIVYLNQHVNRVVAIVDHQL